MSVYCQSLCTSPLEAAVAVMAKNVAGTKYSKAGCPSLVMAFAAKATPNPMTYAACSSDPVADGVEAHAQAFVTVCPHAVM